MLAEVPFEGLDIQRPLDQPGDLQAGGRQRGELDGLYAHLYKLTREDLEYILTTFPMLKKNEERAMGEYRTARLALAGYDALARVLAGMPAPVGASSGAAGE